MLPENDRWSETRSQLLAQMDVSMGGRVAEEIIFGHEYITTGKKGPLNEPESFSHSEEKCLTSFSKCKIHLYGFASSPGASSDFDSATKIAKMMVTRFGMCEKVT